MIILGSAGVETSRARLLQNSRKADQLGFALEAELSQIVGDSRV